MLHWSSQLIGPRQAGQPRESPFFLCSDTHCLQYSRWEQGKIMQSRRRSKHIRHSSPPLASSSSFCMAMTSSEALFSSFTSVWLSSSRCSLKLSRISKKEVWTLLTNSSFITFCALSFSVRRRFSSFNSVTHPRKSSSCWRIMLFSNRSSAKSFSIVRQDGWAIRIIKTILFGLQNVKVYYITSWVKNLLLKAQCLIAFSIYINNIVFLPIILISNHGDYL